MENTTVLKLETLNNEINKIQKEIQHHVSVDKMKIDLIDKRSYYGEYNIKRYEFLVNKLKETIRKKKLFDDQII
jgi:hypothetical protein